MDADAQSGFGFEGKLLRPGSVVTDAQLRPSADYPEIPVLLEYSRMPANGKRGHNRVDALYILWRLHGSEWREIGRSHSASWEWAVDLRPLAVRALAQKAVLAPDLSAVQNRIAASLAQELRGLEAVQQWRVLAIIHDQLASRLCSLPSPVVL